MTDENGILQVAKDLLLRLGRADLNPQAIKWVPLVDSDKPDLFRGRRLGLNKGLQGKLTLEEWRPLLASSLVLNTRMRVKRRTVDVASFVSSFVAFGLFVGLLLLPSAPFLPMGIFSGTLTAGRFIVFIFLGLLFFVFRITGPIRKGLRFRADEIVSQEFGMGPALLNVLRKLDALSLDRGRNVLGQATVKQRIEKLSAKVDEISSASK
ncbi:hypothetical protein J2P12_08735 [Candidatus Bathyarchaeota archaeon]|nr:hypothetical protein [Candidatus Bathyarchaeota archaeon]